MVASFATGLALRTRLAENYADWDARTQCCKIPMWAPPESGTRSTAVSGVHSTATYALSWIIKALVAGLRQAQTATLPANVACALNSATRTSDWTLRRIRRDRVGRNGIGASRAVPGSIWFFAHGSHQATARSIR